MVVEELVPDVPVVEPVIPVEPVMPVADVSVDVIPVPDVIDVSVLLPDEEPPELLPPEVLVAPPLVSLDDVELTLVEAVSEVDVSPFLLPQANRKPASASTARIETAFFIALSFLQINLCLTRSQIFIRVPASPPDRHFDGPGWPEETGESNGGARKTKTPRRSGAFERLTRSTEA